MPALLPVSSDLTVLVAAVERLRQMQPKRDYYASLGAAQERDAVVLWLREWASVGRIATGYDYANEIERGEHRREGDK